MNERENVGNAFTNERRIELRLAEPATVFVERLAAAYDYSEPADIVICNSLDVSASGLQVRMDTPIPPGTILRLCAQFNGDRQPLYVVGEAKWLSEEASQYCLGFELFDSEKTDIIAWKQSIARHLDQ